MARLAHPNIVQIYEIGGYPGGEYLSLELVDGGSLSELLRGGARPPAEAARLVMSLAGAVHYAHEQGIIHRDLKPSNVLLTRDGVPKVTDFGLAKRQEPGDFGMTLQGEILGTPAYMAPEQALGDLSAVGPATDVYGLGAILYELLTGRSPFRGNHAVQILRDVVEGNFPRPREVVKEVPPALEAICLKAMRVKPEGSLRERRGARGRPSPLPRR